MTHENETGTRDYTVQGMTCTHCVASVRDEVSTVAGVETVDIDLTSGRMTLSGSGFDDDAVRTAVAAAGYGVRA